MFREEYLSHLKNGDFISFCLGMMPLAERGVIDYLQRSLLILSGFLLFFGESKPIFKNSCRFYLDFLMLSTLALLASVSSFSASRASVDFTASFFSDELFLAFDGVQKFDGASILYLTMCWLLRSSS